jgi:outer membrane protein assembly factor BamB
VRHLISVILISLILLCGLQAELLTAEDWPNWRGPTGRGLATDSDYPTRWDENTNVAWAFDLPGRGSSTPAVWDGHIFVTCEDQDKNAVICLATDGNLKWKTRVGSYREGKHKKGTGANPSPTTNGQHVFCYFKSGDLACLDFAGKIVWQTNLQNRFAADNLWWDLGTSPLLVGDLLVMACLQTGDSYIVALNKTTGDVAWQVDRNLPAPEEANQSYSTPCVISANAGEPARVVVLGADHVTCHRVEDGQEIWRVGDLNPDQNKFFRSISSPVCSETMVFTCYARGGSLTAIRTGGSGDVTDSHVVWSLEGQFSDVPTPALANGKLYVCSDKGRVVCLDAGTGQEQWSTKLKDFRGGISASPVLTGKHLYIATEDGQTFVLDAEDEGAVVGRGEVGAMLVATPVLVNGRILLRTPERVICIGE